MTRVFALDFSLSREPVKKMRYRKFDWRSEIYLLKKGILAPDGTGEDEIDAWGFFSYVQQKISRTTELGLRYDYFEADHKAYAGDPFAPLAFSSSDGEQWMISPYLTYWQSPFVKYRFELSHLDGGSYEEDENRFTFQVIFDSGPHKHERY